MSISDWVAAVVLLFFIFFGLFAWGLCKAASDADDQLEMMRELHARQEVAVTKEDSE